MSREGNFFFRSLPRRRSKLYRIASRVGWTPIESVSDEQNIRGEFKWSLKWILPSTLVSSSQGMRRRTSLTVLRNFLPTPACRQWVEERLPYCWRVWRVLQMRTEEDSQLDIPPETGKLENKIPLIVIRLFVFHVSLKVYCCLAKFLRCGRVEDGWSSLQMAIIQRVSPDGVPI